MINIKLWFSVSLEMIRGVQLVGQLTAICDSGRIITVFTKHWYPSVFDIPRTVLRDTQVQWKPTRCTISQLYFDKQLCMFRTDLPSTIRSLDTVFTAIGTCHTSYGGCLL